MDNQQRLEIPSSGVTEEFASKVVELVHNLIERCITAYLTQNQTAVKLERDHAIPPSITLEIWRSLEEENSDFFKAYNVRVIAIQQIITFNKLLEQMDRPRPPTNDSMRLG